MRDHNQEGPAWKENAKFLADLINRVGFPIVVAVFLGWLVIFKMDEQGKTMGATLQQLASSMDHLANQIDKLAP